MILCQLPGRSCEDVGVITIVWYRPQGPVADQMGKTQAKKRKNRKEEEKEKRKALSQKIKERNKKRRRERGEVPPLQAPRHTTRAWLVDGLLSCVNLSM